MATTVNSTSSTNTANTQAENGFCILATVQDNNADSYIQSYQALTFDSVPSTTVSRRASVTSYAVESGSEISNHVQIKNGTFTLSGIVTETPVRLKQDMLYGAGVTGNRISQMITYLNQVIEAREPITLLTSHKAFSNIILTGIDYSYKSEHAMQFDLTFEQVRLISTASVSTIALKTSSTKTTGGTVKTKVSASGNGSSLNKQISKNTNTPSNSD